VDAHQGGGGQAAEQSGGDVGELDRQAVAAGGGVTGEQGDDHGDGFWYRLVPGVGTG
jgi:hypothetical protein